MAPKRKNPDELSAREKKKQKTLVARTIAVQSVGPVNSNENVAAGPSAVPSELATFIFPISVWNISPSGIKSLPSAIDVEKFAEVHYLWLHIVRL
jgi:ribonuclease P/MRP protein subunit POP1